MTKTTCRGGREITRCQARPDVPGSPLLGPKVPGWNCAECSIPPGTHGPLSAEAAQQKLQVISEYMRARDPEVSVTRRVAAAFAHVFRRPRLKVAVPTRPVKMPVRYILRPRDGVQVGLMPAADGEVRFIEVQDEEGPIYVAVCSTCGGNCGQCGTSIGSGVPLNFGRTAAMCGWTLPGWGFLRRTPGE